MEAENHHQRLGVWGACPDLVDGRQGVALGLWWGTDRVWVPELLQRGDEITFSSTFCHSQPRHWREVTAGAGTRRQECLEGKVQEGIISSGAEEGTGVRVRREGPFSGSALSQRYPDFPVLQVKGLKCAPVKQFVQKEQGF